MKKFYFLFLFLGVVFVETAAAETMIGYAPSYVNLSINDPDGDTDNISDGAPLALVVVYDFNNKTRLYSVIDYIDTSLDASTDKIGQKISAYQLLATYQHEIKLSHALKFYAGIGLGYTQADFENRHTVDSDGFLATRYENREESYFSAVLNLSREWEATEKFNIGIDLSYQYDFEDVGFSGFKGALVCFYRF